MNTPAAMANPVRHTRLAMWRRQHAWCLRDSVRQLARRPVGTLLTIVVMGLALALPLAFYLLLVNVQHLATAVGDSQSVNVFLKTDVAASGADTLAATLRARADVAAVTVRTPQQGLTELAALQGFGDALQSTRAALHALSGDGRGGRDFARLRQAERQRVAAVRGQLPERGNRGVEGLPHRHGGFDRGRRLCCVAGLAG